jgi:hypothetical protein
MLLDIGTSGQSRLLRSHLHDDSPAVGQQQFTHAGQVTAGRKNLDWSRTKPHRAPVGDRTVVHLIRSHERKLPVVHDADVTRAITFVRELRGREPGGRHADASRSREAHLTTYVARI